MCEGRTQGNVDSNASEFLNQDREDQCFVICKFEEFKQVAASYQFTPEDYFLLYRYQGHIQGCPISQYKEFCDKQEKAAFRPQQVIHLPEMPPRSIAPAASQSANILKSPSTQSKPFQSSIPSPILDSPMSLDSRSLAVSGFDTKNEEIKSSKAQKRSNEL